MLRNAITKAAVYAMDQPAPFLRYTAAGTYTLSTLVQAAGVAMNPKIPQKEKNFLIPQELINGALQLITFLTLATTLENWGKRLAEKGIIVASNASQNGPTFIKGVAVLFSIVGTVLAFNVLTPLIRNPVAHYIQKKMGKKATPEQTDMTRPIIPAVRFSSGKVFSNTSPFAGFENSIQSGKLPVKVNYFA